MPDVTSRSPKRNRSSTSSTTQRSLVPCRASYCPSLALHSDPSTGALQTFKPLATFHPRISVHGLTSEAFCSRTIAGSSHNIEEKNWDTPSLASSSLTQKAAVPQFLSCCDSYPKDCGLTYAAACQPAAFDTQPGWGKRPRGHSSTPENEFSAEQRGRSSTHTEQHVLQPARWKSRHVIYILEIKHGGRQTDRRTRSPWWFALLIK